MTIRYVGSPHLTPNSGHARFAVRKPWHRSLHIGPATSCTALASLSDNRRDQRQDRYHGRRSNDRIQVSPHVEFSFLKDGGWSLFFCCPSGSPGAVLCHFKIVGGAEPAATH